MNNRMAAPTKNSAPIITLSRTLTGRAWNSKPPIAPGQSQQTAPATAKAMARILIAIAALVALAPWRIPASLPFVSRLIASSAAIFFRSERDRAEKQTQLSKERIAGFKLDITVAGIILDARRRKFNTELVARSGNGIAASTFG
jgi:hypothetical protein